MAKDRRIQNGTHGGPRRRYGDVVEADLTPAAENHLKAIWAELEAGRRATTTALARRLGVAPPSVTAMVRRLAADGLVVHRPYQGVTLTDAGRRVAAEVVRHHRLVELYLAEVLGVPWDEVHEEAERLEHVISERLEHRMAEALGHPTHDPHGAPIPALDGTVGERAVRELAGVEAGETVVFAEVDDDDGELLRHLDALGLRPGRVVHVSEVDPCDGPMRLRVDGRDVVLGRRAARAVRVREGGA